MSYRPWARLLAQLILPKANREIITRNPPSVHHSEHVLNLARRMGLAAPGDFPYVIARDKNAAEHIKQKLAEKQESGECIG